MPDHTPEAIDKAVPQQLPPEHCRPWRFHNRSDAWLVPAHQASLVESIGIDGQQQPGLVRELKAGAEKQYEIIFGMRRCAACKTAEKPFVARVLPADTPEQVCARLMHIENEERANVSDLERARHYRDLMAGGVFASQAEFCLLYTSPSPRDRTRSRMPSSA